jgi:prepilin-type N-terminal cleavage/methylation domain-containing protein
MNNDRKTNNDNCLGKPFSRKGFTLIEIAFVLVLIGILVGFGAQMLPMLVKQNRLKEDRELVKEAKNAIIAYAVATGNLPYASNNANGLPTPGLLNGRLPWSTLGIRSKDAYQTTLSYAVDMHLVAAGSITKAVLNPLIATPPPANQNLYTDFPGSVRVAFVVISAGENRKIDVRNDKNGNGTIGYIDAGDGNVFESPSTIITSTYDDIVEAESLTSLAFLAP